MGLTEHEKRELDAIEQHLTDDDPGFATKLTKPSWHTRLSGTTLFVAGLLTTYVAGLAVLATGVTFSSWPLTAVGIAVTAVFPVIVTARAVKERLHGS